MIPSRPPAMTTVKKKQGEKNRHLGCLAHKKTKKLARLQSRCRPTRTQPVYDVWWRFLGGVGVLPLLRVILLHSSSSMASYNDHIQLNVGMFDHLHNIEQINGAGWPRSWWQDTGANLSFSNVFFFFVFPSNNLSFRTFSLLFQKTLSTRRMYECVTIQNIHIYTRNMKY